MRSKKKLPSFTIDEAQERLEFYLSRTPYKLTMMRYSIFTLNAMPASDSIANVRQLADIIIPVHAMELAQPRSFQDILRSIDTASLVN